MRAALVLAAALWPAAAGAQPLPPTIMVAPAYSTGPLDWGALGADTGTRVLLLGSPYTCPELDLALALHAAELARAGITHYWVPPGWVGSGEDQAGRSGRVAFSLYSRFQAALEAAGVAALEVGYDDGVPSPDFPVALSLPPDPPGRRTVRYLFKPPGGACLSSEFEWAARAVTGFLAEDASARLLLVDSPQRRSGFSLEQPLAWLGTPVRSLLLVDDLGFLEGLEVPRPIGPGLYRPLGRPGDPRTEIVVLPELQGRACLKEHRPEPRRAPEAWGCEERPQLFDRLLRLSEPVLADPKAAAELTHARGALDRLGPRRRLCVCEFLAGGGHGWNPASGSADSSGRISLSSDSVRDLALTLKTFWHEAQHVYDHEAVGAGTYSIEWEERAWRASCAFLEGSVRLGTEGADRVLGEECGKAFIERAKSWCEVPTAAQAALAAAGDAGPLAATRCRELERARRGNPLSLEGFEPRWSARECAQQARVAGAEKGARSRPVCGVWGE
ncbi:MAG: hypothetical protein HYZ75_05575 [Elusimicrobia bacterium]|nr:hypothetical protein [Elusimicrobiota bacterium]